MSALVGATHVSFGSRHNQRRGRPGHSPAIIGTFSFAEML